MLEYVYSEGPGCCDREVKTIVSSSLMDHFYSSIEKEDQIGDYVTNVEVRKPPIQCGLY